MPPSSGGRIDNLNLRGLPHEIADIPLFPIQIFPFTRTRRVLHNLPSHQEINAGLPAVPPLRQIAAAANEELEVISLDDKKWRSQSAGAGVTIQVSIHQPVAEITCHRVLSGERPLGRRGPKTSPSRRPSAPRQPDKTRLLKV